jgi:iron complex outermembrane receptor protein
MKNLIVFVLLLISFTGVAQDVVLRGKIVDQVTALPLQGASIRYGENAGTVSDTNGEFSIPCSGAMDIKISFVGYQTLTRHVNDCNEQLAIGLTVSSSILDEVEITATSELNRSMLSQPTSISKISTPEIQRGTGLFLDDAINANVPGVFMQRRTVSGGQSFNIRGYGGGGPGVRGINSNFDQQGIKGYLNGIPITDAEGISVFDDIDFGSVGNVEITKGPAGTLYGLAVAGVINLRTVQPERGKRSVSQDVLFGSYGLNRFTTRLQIGGERSSVLVNYGKQNYDGFMKHTNSTKDFVNVVGDFRPNNKQSITTYFGWSNSYDARNGELTAGQYDTLNYSGNPVYIKNDAHSNIISFRAGLGHTYQFADNISNTTSVFGTGVSNNASSAGGWTDKAAINYGFRSVFDTKFTLNEGIRLSGVTGIEAQKQNAQTVAYPMVVNNADPDGYNIIGAIRSNQSNVSSTYSVFTQWTLSLPRDLSFTAGVGSSSMNLKLIDKFYVAANNTATNTQPGTYTTSYPGLVSPHVAVNKIISKNVSVYASYSQGFKAPVGSNIYTPLAGKVNTGLKPEKGVQLEVGTKGSLLNDKLAYEVALFQATFSNKMTLVGVPNASNTATLYSYVINSGEYDNKGLEMLVKYRIYQSEGPVKVIKAFGNMTYSDFKYNSFTFQNNVATPPADYSNKSVAGVPKIIVNGGIDFTLAPGIYGDVVYMYRGDMPYTPDGVNIAKGFGLLNAKFGFRRSLGAKLDADVYFGINNITGVQYYQMVFVNQLPDAYLPGPNEANYFGGLMLKYNF